MRGQNPARRLVAISPVVTAAERECPRCHCHYDISDPAASYEHNNKLCPES
ncbi:hypothetical protein KIK06_29090 [Nocardiopsis sp. EMB25]|uniref:hypothetical protein n=1 Tax=Nocardiopsis sp. EMB25 TaxID=2835867 RepID=UPI0022848B1B|nr:hypothetical protein [Nocardiopsis sp. EMB25]MCY9787940.1 hypothetical protein [Nocardiopsis sp. EMB25]